MNEIDAGLLVLRPVRKEVADALLAGGKPRGVAFAQDYPSQFSLEVMELVTSAGTAADSFGPFFMITKTDGVVVGEIGCSFHSAAATVQVGYSVVESRWGQGYATDALRALIRVLLARPGVHRVVAETMVGHTASRRVMEKAGMRECGEGVGVEGGETVQLVIYETATGNSADGRGVNRAYGAS